MNEQMQKDSNKDAQFKNRRKKADWVTKAASILSVIAWIIVIVMLLLLDRAQPQSADFFTHVFRSTVHSSWNSSLLRTSFIMLVSAFFICALAMILNILRHRRKTDKYKKSIIILGVLSLIGLILFMIRFKYYL